MIPKSTRRLLSLGLVLGFAVALPLFVWVVVSPRFNFNPQEKAGITERVSVSTDDDPSIGPLNAPITIVEFADFQCEFCKAFQDQTFAGLMDAYPNQIRFVLRDFPITELHPMAQKAAEAANCAGDQGVYWQMHDAIFANQSEITEENLKIWAESLEVDTTQFNTCYDTSQFATEVQNDYEDGLSYGVSGTPTFFINGIVLEGFHPLADFQEIIDEELNPQSPTEPLSVTPAPSATFDPSNITFTITSTGQSPNFSVSPSQLATGKTYNVTANFILSGSATPIVKLLINDTTIGQVQTQSGATNEITGSFTPTETTNKYILWITDTNFYSIDVGPSGPPNSCNGTCGSNFNCTSGLFCSQGFCRNPSCPSDRTCGCATPTPSATLRSTPRPSQTPEVVFLPPGGINRITTPKPIATQIPTLVPTPVPTMQTNFMDYAIVGGSGLLVIILIIIAIKLLRKSQEPPRFFPPTS